MGANFLFCFNNWRRRIVLKNYERNRDENVEEGTQPKFQIKGRAWVEYGSKGYDSHTGAVSFPI